MEDRQEAPAQEHHLAKKVKRSFIAVVVVSAVVLTILGWQVKTTSDLTSKLKKSQGVQASQQRTLAAQQKTLAAQQVKLAAQVKVNRKLAAQGKEAHDGICFLKSDLRRRIREATAQVRASEEFLREHPQGIAGISARVIRQGIVSQQRTLANQTSGLKAFHAVQCLSKSRPRSRT